MTSGVLRTAALALALLATCMPARAADDGPPPAREVLARLDSDDPCEIAWGAWLAAEHRLASARGHVIPLLERLARGSVAGDASWILEEHALDLAIRLEVMPPRELLEAFVAGGRPSVAALLLAFPDPPARTLVGVFQHCRDDFEPEAWIALGNLMVRRRTPGFAACVLRGQTLRRTLRVWDDDEDHPPPRRPRDGICYDGFREAPEGYPPTVQYGLRLAGRSDDGEHLVSWTRSVRFDGRLGFGGVTGTWPDPRPVREGWLRRLVGADGAKPPAWDAHHDVEYVGRQPWERDLRAWIGGIHERHWRLVGVLLDCGAVTAAEVPHLGPRIHVDVWDGRRDARRPLPPIPEVVPAVPRWLGRRLDASTRSRDPR